MIVTIAADVLGVENNGTTTACMNLVRYLQARGDEVRILCCDQDKKGMENYYVVPTLNLGSFLNKIVEKNGVVLAKPDKNIITEAIKDADVVHVMMPFALGKKATKIAKKLNKPVTAGFHVQAENFTSHIGMMNCGIINHLTYKSFYRGMYKDVDAIHYPTEFIKTIFERNVHKKTNAYVISNGVHNRFQKMDIAKPEELKGKQILAVVNFPPRQIANFLSEVLVLGTYSKQGVVLIKPDINVENGDKLG